MNRPERLARYERLVRRMRQRIFDYDDSKEAQASRVLSRALSIKAKLTPNTTKVDQWGATQADRDALARHGMAWGD